MKRYSWFLSLFLIAPLHLSAQSDLTESQIAAITAQLDGLRKAQEEGTTRKNSGAAVTFKQASENPKAALGLYLKCVEEVEFNRLGKTGSDFREWQSNPTREALFNFEPFLTSLQLQLEYLSLSTRAAYEEDISTLFPDLTSFLGKIATLKSPPHPQLNKGVGTTVFADVYKLDTQLARAGETWEANPMNIGSIYDKTIMPYLREAKPEQLDPAWTNRIATEGNLARLYYDFEDEMDRFIERLPEGREMGGIKNEMRRFVRSQAEEGAVFSEKRLPVLQWRQLVDQFSYKNKAYAAKAMLDHIQKHLAHEDAKMWIESLNSLVTGGTAGPATADQ